MSADDEPTVPHEVVIVRRRGEGGDDGHHGGAWKIAFADLMTAMMAFFLVMWLLNVSDKEKIQQIATYFNPLKLNSKRETTKGVVDEQDTDKPKSPKIDGPEDHAPDKSDVNGKEKHQGANKPGGDGELKEGVAQKAEEELFNDPYGVLARLALKASDDSEHRDSTAVPAGGGDAFSNPFEPYVDRQASQEKSDQQIERSPMTLDESGEIKPLPLTPEIHETPPKDALDKPIDGATPGPAAEPKDGEETKDGKAPLASQGADVANAPADANASGADKDKEKEKVRALEQAISKALANVAPDKRPSIDVQATEEGLLISLTDDFRFGMFSTASAEPTPELVVVMDKVAKVLANDYKGSIVVRGHTDARQFKNPRDNNWRLSTARAQVAYFMLKRGGVEEGRFDRIEGHADRDLKVPSDPNADENRRIEILIEVPRP
jgi:chemotaxis protein MotB